MRSEHRTAPQRRSARCEASTGLPRSGVPRDAKRAPDCPAAAFRAMRSEHRTAPQRRSARCEASKGPRDGSRPMRAIQGRRIARSPGERRLVLASSARGEGGRMPVASRSAVRSEPWMASDERSPRTSLCSPGDRPRLTTKQHHRRKRYADFTVTPSTARANSVNASSISPTVMSSGGRNRSERTPHAQDDHPRLVGLALHRRRARRPSGKSIAHMSPRPRALESTSGR